MYFILNRGYKKDPIKLKKKLSEINKNGDKGKRSKTKSSALAENILSNIKSEHSSNIKMLSAHSLEKDYKQTLENQTKLYNLFFSLAENKDFYEQNFKAYTTDGNFQLTKDEEVFTFSNLNENDISKVRITSFNKADETKRDYTQQYQKKLELLNELKTILALRTLNGAFKVLNEQTKLNEQTDKNIYKSLYLELITKQDSDSIALKDKIETMLNKMLNSKTFDKVAMVASYNAQLANNEKHELRISNKRSSKYYRPLEMTALKNLKLDLSTDKFDIRNLSQIPNKIFKNDQHKVSIVDDGSANLNNLHTKHFSTPNDNSKIPKSLTIVSYKNYPIIKKSKGEAKQVPSEQKQESAVKLISKENLSQQQKLALEELQNLKPNESNSVPAPQNTNNSPKSLAQTKVKNKSTRSNQDELKHIVNTIKIELKKLKHLNSKSIEQICVNLNRSIENNDEESINKTISFLQESIGQKKIINQLKQLIDNPQLKIQNPQSKEKKISVNYNLDEPKQLEKIETLIFQKANNNSNQFPILINNEQNLTDNKNTAFNSEFAKLIDKLTEFKNAKSDKDKNLAFIEAATILSQTTKVFSLQNTIFDILNNNLDINKKQFTHLDKINFREVMRLPDNLLKQFVELLDVEFIDKLSKLKHSDAFTYLSKNENYKNRLQNMLQSNKILLEIRGNSSKLSNTVRNNLKDFENKYSFETFKDLLFDTKRTNFKHSKVLDYLNINSYQDLVKNSIKLSQLDKLLSDELSQNNVPVYGLTKLAGFAKLLKAKFEASESVNYSDLYKSVTNQTFEDLFVADIVRSYKRKDSSKVYRYQEGGRSYKLLGLNLVGDNKRYFSKVKPANIISKTDSIKSKINQKVPLTIQEFLSDLNSPTKQGKYKRLLQDQEVLNKLNFIKEFINEQNK